MKRLLTVLLAVLGLSACSRDFRGPFRLTGLQVDYMTTPLGIDAPSPRFSWKMESRKYAQSQASYRIVVSELHSGECVWDSGNVLSGMSAGILYGGEALKPCTRYEWTVEVTGTGEHSSKASS